MYRQCTPYREALWQATLAPEAHQHLESAQTPNHQVAKHGTKDLMEPREWEC